MARYFNFYILVLLLLFVSCQNEGDIGSLYGQWALKTSFVNGQSSEHDNLYFSFQGKVVWAKSVNASNHTYNDVFGRFDQVGDSIMMNFVQKSEYTTPRSLIEEKCGFSDADNVRVLIKELDSSKMILSDGDNHWLFEKF